MKPIVHGLAHKYEGRISFIYVDITDPGNSNTKRTLEFRSTPHFVLLAADGRLLADSIGVMPARDFEVWLTSHLLPDSLSHD